ncbi:MAG: hypothetical protein GY757_61805, partial [bacterium]|nr:hypothetical protein [bacterium]
AEVRKYIRRDNYSSPAFKRRMNACAYYYEYLHEKEWADDIWLKFFEQFGHQVADFQQGKRTDGIPFKYQELLEKNLPEIEPVKLQQHHNAVKKYLPFSHLAPYLEFLYGDDMPEQLIRKIQNKKRAQKVFSLFLQYMETYHMWTRYAGLFAACDDKLKSCFSKPLFDKVHSHLAQQYQALKENFIETGTISIEALDTFYNLIPGDEAFRS